MSPPEFEVVSLVGGMWAVLADGFQWSPPGGPVDHELGIGTSEYPTPEDARAAVLEAHPDALVTVEPRVEILGGFVLHEPGADPEAVRRAVRRQLDR